MLSVTDTDNPLLMHYRITQVAVCLSVCMSDVSHRLFSPNQLDQGSWKKRKKDGGKQEKKLLYI